MFKDIRDKEFSITLNPADTHQSAGDSQMDHKSCQGSALAPWKFPHNILTVFLHKSTATGNSKSKLVFSLCGKSIFYFCK